MSGALTKPERSTLAECESVIEHGLDNFIEVGNALLQIREGRLYDKKPGHAGFADFETYCRDRWDMSGRRAHQLIDSAKVIQNIGTEPRFSPIAERQTRPLKALPPQQQREVWQEASATAKTPGKPTAREVELVIEKRTQSKRTSPTPPKCDSELLSLLKSYWVAASRRERAQFIEWIKQNE